MTRLTNRRLAAACWSGGKLAVDLVGPLLQRLLEARILAEADLGILCLGPGLLERVFEQRQLADVVLVAAVAAQVEPDLAQEALGQLGIDAAAYRLGRAFDRRGQLGRGHRPEADLAILDGGAQPVVGLDVGVEVGADAEHQGAGRLGGGVQDEVDEQARIGGAASVLVGA